MVTWQNTEGFEFDMVTWLWLRIFDKQKRVLTGVDQQELYTRVTNKYKDMI
jgi:hypothetical protein